MRSRPLFLAAMLVLAIAPDLFAQSNTPSEEAVRAAIEEVNTKLEEAWAASDADAVAALYTEDAQLLVPSAEPIEGRAAILEANQTGFQRGTTKLQLNTVELDVMGDTAYEVGGYVVESASGQHLDHGKYIVIWKLEDGQWRLHRDIINSSMAQ